MLAEAQLFLVQEQPKLALNCLEQAFSRFDDANPQLPHFLVELDLLKSLAFVQQGLADKARPLLAYASGQVLALKLRPQARLTRQVRMVRKRFTQLT